MLTLDDRVRAGGDMLSTTVDGETVVLDITNGIYVNLNAMGSEILRRLEKEMTLRELCRDLSSEFTVPPEQIEREVVGFAVRLQDAGLIRRVV